jgi:predicted methyltransferase
MRRSVCVAALLAAALLVTGCAAWKRFSYEGFGRDDWQQPDEVLALLAIRPGDRVADLGAGGGYFTFRLAEAVGPGGRVYAVDIDDDMLAHLARRARETGAANVEIVRADADDPRLPDGEIDLLFTSARLLPAGARRPGPERPRRDRRVRPARLVRSHVRPRDAG